MANDEKKMNPKLQALLEKKKAAQSEPAPVNAKQAALDRIAELKLKKQGSAKQQSQVSILDDDNTVPKSNTKDSKVIAVINPPKSDKPVQLNNNNKNSATYTKIDERELAQAFERFRQDVRQQIDSFYSNINTKLSKDGIIISEKDEWCEVEYGDKLDIKKIQELASEGWRYAFPKQYKDKDGRMQYEKMYFFRPIKKTIKVKNNNH